ncbi:hypothetical protein [Nocardia sp. XZ_19_385]|uniref:hypothetical protein n=1 Tax=Nocardia sp. XZ_19_385 TaxID=2769488 RepID=UPI00188F816C|nr:hypothetical protein [Nocardia sp. XZ_19_385]
MTRLPESRHPAGEIMALAHPRNLPDDLAGLRAGSGSGNRRLPTMSPGETEHDAFFGIRREPADAGLLWRAAADRVYRSVVSQLATTASDRVAADALDGLAAEFPELRRTATEQPAPAWTGLEWWINGHRLFAVLTQAATVGLRHTIRQVQIGDLAAAAVNVNTTATLFRCSATALRITGNFSRTEYQESVRPRMAPPHLSAGFSGLLSVDHRMLVAALHDWRPYAGEPALRGLSDQLRDGLAAAYSAHEGVCDRFVGGEGPSLRTAIVRHQPAAAAVLHDLAQQRLRLLGPGE